jgi:hypothetical protein
MWFKRTLALEKGLESEIVIDTEFLSKSDRFQLTEDKQKIIQESKLQITNAFKFITGFSLFFFLSFKLGEWSIDFFGKIIQF